MSQNLNNFTWKQLLVIIPILLLFMFVVALFVGLVIWVVALVVSSAFVVQPLTYWQSFACGLVLLSLSTLFRGK